MMVELPLPEDLVAAIDQRTKDRGKFIIAAIRRMLATDSFGRDRAELEKINAHAAELNEEAGDVLAFQVIR